MTYRFTFCIRLETDTNNIYYYIVTRKRFLYTEQKYLHLKV